MTAVPPPIERSARAVRAPFDGRDDRFEHLHATDTDAWRDAVRLDRVLALFEPLDGIEVSDHEHRLIEWLAGFDIPTVAVFTRLLHAARAAAPLDDPAP